MARQRPEKTLADYAAIAISPVLIMLLVGSLVFFLAEAVYAGNYPGQLRWILFWFVLASVLVSRIGIEQGTALASTYGAVLGLVTALVILRYVQSYVVGALCLLGVIWWCTNKLTWDCTLIDDSEDASGEGLLKSAGLDACAEPDEAAADADADSSGQAEADSTGKPRATADGDAESPSWWQAFVGKPKGRDGRPHAPGKWVVYFSLAALPLFGFGQLMIPIEKTASRAWAFKLLWVYVASGLALLVTTSFLGLRRYLRQRRLRMPTPVTATWLGMGGGLILAIMMLCILLPRPNANYSMAQLIDNVSSKVKQASKNALMKGEAGEGDGKRLGKSGEGKSVDPGKSGGGKTGRDNDKGDGGGKSKAGGQQGDGDAKTGAGDKNGKNQGGKKQQQDRNGRKNKQGKTARGQRGDKQQRNDEQRGERKTRDEARRDGNRDRRNDKRQRDERQAAEDQPQDSESKIAKTAEWIGKFFKWLIYAIIAVVILLVVFKGWRGIVEGVAAFFRGLRDFFAGLFGRKAKAAAAGDSDDSGGPAAEPPPPFASFANPFHTGSARQMAPKTLIAYTFEAFESWAYEHGVERRADQTPAEFADAASERVDGFGRDAAQLARLQTRALYAERQPTSRCFGALEQIWERMAEQSAAARRGVPVATS